MNKFLGLGLLVLAGVLAVPAFAADKADAKKKGPEAAFKKLDSNNDGKLSKTEFAKIAEKRKNKGKPVKEGAIDKRFGKLDTNNDGSVSADEFKAKKKGKKKKTDAAQQ
jgi:Ca2+-binding EF-hand superfamily protein